MDEQTTRYRFPRIRIEGEAPQQEQEQAPIDFSQLQANDELTNADIKFQDAPIVAPIPKMSEGEAQAAASEAPVQQNEVVAKVDPNSVVQQAIDTSAKTDQEKNFLANKLAQDSGDGQTLGQKLAMIAMAVAPTVVGYALAGKKGAYAGAAATGKGVSEGIDTYMKEKQLEAQRAKATASKPGAIKETVDNYGYVFQYHDGIPVPVMVPSQEKNEDGTPRMVQLRRANVSMTTVDPETGLPVTKQSFEEAPTQGAVSAPIPERTSTLKNIWQRKMENAKELGTEIAPSSLAERFPEVDIYGVRPSNMTQSQWDNLKYQANAEIKAADKILGDAASKKAMGEQTRATELAKQPGRMAEIGAKGLETRKTEMVKGEVQKGLEQTKQTGRVELEGVKQKGRVDLANINNAAKEKLAKMKTAIEKTTKPDMYDVKSTGTNVRDWGKSKKDDLSAIKNGQNLLAIMKDSDTIQTSNGAAFFQYLRLVQGDNSVIREGDYNIAMQFLPLKTRVDSFLNTYAKGESRMTPEMRKEITSFISKYNQLKESQIVNVANSLYNEAMKKDGGTKGKYFETVKTNMNPDIKSMVKTYGSTRMGPAKSYPDLPSAFKELKNGQFGKITTNGKTNYYMMTDQDVDQSGKTKGGRLVRWSAE